MYRRVLLLSTFSFAIFSASLAWAQAAAAGRVVPTFDGTGANAWSGNVRVSDEQLISLFDEGLKKSPTFRALVERLSKSDVILYVRPDVTVKADQPTKLTFLTARGGFRYISIRVAASGSKVQQIAMFGHEMQHAVAIADAPGVVDSASLRREFERIGKVSQPSGGDDFIFENERAEEARRRIISEVSAQPGKATPTVPAVASTTR